MRTRKTPNMDTFYAVHYIAIKSIEQKVNMGTNWVEVNEHLLGIDTIGVVLVSLLSNLNLFHTFF